MTTTDPRPPQHTWTSAAQHAEHVRQATADIDRALRDMIATHDLPEAVVVSHRVEEDGARSLVLVAGSADDWSAWAPYLDSTGVVSPGPYPVGGEQLRVRVGRLAGVETVLIVDDALQVLTRRRGDVTADAPRDPETTSAATS